MDSDDSDYAIFDVSPFSLCFGESIKEDERLAAMVDAFSPPPSPKVQLHHDVHMPR